jgi:hypothetical protein
MSETCKATKRVQIIGRVSFKENSAVIVYLCRSSRGAAQYTVTLYNGKASCDCPARKPCYHMAECEQAERTREKQRAEAALCSHPGEDLPAYVQVSLGATCYCCPNPVKPGFTMCPQCSGSAAA